MTRLTYLFLINVRGSDPEPIPFPSQFCNMIYLQKFTSNSNNLSGFGNNNKSIDLLFVLFSGPIPIELTRLVGLKLFVSEEPLLTGLRFNFHSVFFCFQN